MVVCFGLFVCLWVKKGRKKRRREREGTLSQLSVINPKLGDSYVMQLIMSRLLKKSIKRRKKTWFTKQVICSSNFSRSIRWWLCKKVAEHFQDLPYEANLRRQPPSFSSQGFKSRCSHYNLITTLYFLNTFHHQSLDFLIYFLRFKR